MTERLRVLLATAGDENHRAREADDKTDDQGIDRCLTTRQHQLPAGRGRWCRARCYMDSLPSKRAWLRRPPSKQRRSNFSLGECT